MQKVIEYAEYNNSRFINELIELLKIPSISNDPDSKREMEKCARWIEDQMKTVGLENVKIFKTEGHPIVYGEWLNAGKDKPTVLMYGHYDVQPVDPVELWSSPPFEPVIKDNIIYGRGTTDDKGQFFIHFKSLESHFKIHGKLPINVKVLIEGEEEIGSPNLGKFIKENTGLLKSDYVLISDTAMYDNDLPSICYGLRGLAYMQIDITGPNSDLHSGSFGGAVENPINALSNIISKLKDEKGKILIDGFYDDVLDLTPQERNEFKRLPFDDDKFKRSLGVDELFGEEGYTTIERKSARPTLDVNGIWGGFQGQGAKTVIPSTAGTKISMRLVPNQQPKKIEKLFIDFVNKIAPKTVKINVTALHSGNGSITPIDTPAVKAAMNALKKGYNIEPVFMREGGSIPIVSTFKEYLGADAILMGFGLQDENAHSPDEHFDLRNFIRGIYSISYYLDELADLKKYKQV